MFLLNAVWAIEPASAVGPEVVYAGVDPAALFRSDDRGETFRLNQGLFVNVFVDGENLRSLSGLDTAIGPDAEVWIHPALSGGRRTNSRDRGAALESPAGSA
ncbi:MAG TPA: hypothetical protein VGI47_10430 [Candidatus Binataceae bacterium]